MTAAFVIIAFALAAVPAGLFLVNSFLYRRSKPASLSASSHLPPVSVLIPARNESASSIAGSIESVLAQTGVDFEVVVLDDHSEDDTAQIVQNLAGRDARVRLQKASTLPAGWCGKQFACHSLTGHARHGLFLFMDADVRLLPDALCRMVGALNDSKADLLSGIPRQITGSFLEKLLLPLIHFVLLGFLPMPGMRLSRHPKYAAGCGQLMLARKEAYLASEGHAAIRASLHDGLKLPKAFRQAGCKTDLVDATDLAECRMYTSNRDTWNGLAKNATEGLAAPGVLAPMTLLLAGGQILPFLLIGFWDTMPDSMRPLAWAALACAWMPRWVSLLRYRQSWLGALLHPLGILILLALQWQAFWRKSRGGELQWKGRSYGEAQPSAPTRVRPSSPVPETLRKTVLWLMPLSLLVSAYSFLRADTGKDDLPPASKISSFQLEDQYERSHKIEFPASKPVLLLVADRQGAEQIDGWLRTVRKHYDINNGPFLLMGLADVRAVPGPLRPFVRKKFQKAHSYPVMMDWEGAVIDRFHLEPEQANVFLIQASGTILHRERGETSAKKWSTLNRAIEQRPSNPPPAPL